MLLASLAATTCLMRASIGDILAAPGGEPFITATLAETQAIAGANGLARATNNLARFKAILTERGSGFTASMLRDLETGGRIEADHIIGDLLRRGEEQGVDTPLLRVAYTHLKAYEARSGREQAAARTAAGSGVR